MIKHLSENFLFWVAPVPLMQRNWQKKSHWCEQGNKSFPKRKRDNELVHSHVKTKPRQCRKKHGVYVPKRTDCYSCWLRTWLWSCWCRPGRRNSPCQSCVTETCQMVRRQTPSASPSPQLSARISCPNRAKIPPEWQKSSCFAPFWF